MNRWIKFLLIAIGVFTLIAGGGALVLPPDPFSTAPTTIVALVICWPIAYWLTYHESRNPRLT